MQIQLQAWSAESGTGSVLPIGMGVADGGATMIIHVGVTPGITIPDDEDPTPADMTISILFSNMTDSEEMDDYAREMQEMSRVLADYAEQILSGDARKIRTEEEVLGDGE